jgi:N-acetylglucosaminyl-diphospho-decaprenol L-rhamnosyltransferase
MVTHLLLTKYNSRISDDPTFRPGLDERWLGERLELFARWPLPSIRRQSTPPDGWLLFLDADTPVDHLDALHELVGKDAEIVLSQEHLTGQMIGEIINDRLPPGPSVLLTTRLDSDDALAVSHLQQVRANASFRGFVNPASGLQLVGGRVLRSWDRSSSFLTRIEERAGDRPPLSVLAIEHTKAHTVAPVRQLGGPPAWLQVIHGGNRANVACGIPWSRRRGAEAMGVAELPAVPDADGARPGLMRPIVHQLALAVQSRIRARRQAAGR